MKDTKLLESVVEQIKHTIDYLKRYGDEDGLNRQLECEMVKLEACEKMLPKKMRVDRTCYLTYYHCPSCDKAYFSFDYRDDCCNSCGQALDWTEVEAKTKVCS